MNISLKSRSIRPFYQKLARLPPAILVSAALAMATLLRMALSPIFGAGYTFITFYPATMFSTVIAGWRYGLATALAAALLSVALFINPLANVEHATALIVFLVVDGFMIVIADGAGRARRRAELEKELALARGQDYREEITERKRMEEALRQSQQRLAATQANAPIGIVELSLEGRYLNVNQAFCDMVGYSCDELLKLHFTDITFAEDRPRNQELFQQLKAGEIPSSQLEKRFVLKDGTLVWVNVSRTLVKDEAGKPSYVIGAILDITKSKEAEAATQASEERLSLAQSVAHIGVWEWWVQTNETAFNDEYYGLYGLPQGVPHGYADFLERVHPEDRADVDAAMQRALAGQQPYQAEYRIVRAVDGAIRWLAGSGQVSIDASGQPLRAIGVVMDITERKQAEQALRESELRFRTIAEEIGDVFWMGDPTQKKLVYASQAFEEIWGRGLKQLYDDFDTWLEAIHEEDRERVKHEFFTKI